MESINQLVKELLQNPPSSKTLFILLKELRKISGPGEIIKECNRLLEFYPDDINLRSLLVESYLEQGSVSLADSEAEKLINSVNELNKAYRLHAEVLKRQGRDEEAVNSLKLYMAHFPDDDEAKALLSELEAKVMEKEKPVPEEEVTEESEEEIVEVVTPRIAEVYFEQGLIEDAISTYEKIVENNPDDEKSKARLEQLRHILAEKDMEQEKERLKEKDEKTVAILEAWLDRMRKTMSQDTLSGAG